MTSESKDVAAAVAELRTVASQVTACAARATDEKDQWTLRANGKLLARWASAIEAGPPERAARAVTALRRVGAGWLDVAASEPGALWARALAAVEALPDSLTLEEAVARLYRAFKRKRAAVGEPRSERVFGAHRGAAADGSARRGHCRLVVRGVLPGGGRSRRRRARAARSRSPPARRR